MDNNAIVYILGGYFLSQVLSYTKKGIEWLVNRERERQIRFENFMSYSKKQLEKTIDSFKDEVWADIKKHQNSVDKAI